MRVITRVPQTRPSQVRIDRTKMMRGAYTKSLRTKTDLEKLIEEMNPETEKNRLAEMLLRDALEAF